MRVVSSAQMQQIEQEYFASGKASSYQLMENAAQCLLAPVLARTPKRVNIVCGAGNNAGDGLALARLLHQRAVSVSIIMLYPPEKLSADAKRNYDWATQLKIEITTDLVFDGDVVVDAILGTGLNRPLTSQLQGAVQAINTAGKYVLAVDIPTGIDGDTGKVMGACVQANETVTFTYPKIGHLLYPGRAMAGKLTVAPIGIAQQCGEYTLLDCAFLHKHLPPRNPHTHKGDYGKVAILGGSFGMVGAAKLSAMAALRAGCGLSTLVLPYEMARQAQFSLLECMCKGVGNGEHFSADCAQEILAIAQQMDCLAIGPGLGREKGLTDLVQALLAQAQIPLVLDADALFAVAQHPQMLQNAKHTPVITPHAMEFARLCNLPLQQITEDPLQHALTFAKKYNCVVLLKGSTSLVAAPDGHVALQTAGNPGMATAGSGDVLTGCVAAMLARKIPAFFAASCATYLHALAGDAAAAVVGENALIASDILQHLGAWERQSAPHEKETF